MIPSGITEGQDFFLDRVTFRIKFFHFFDCIIHFGVIMVIMHHLNNKSEINALLHCLGKPLKCFM